MSTTNSDAPVFRKLELKKHSIFYKIGNGALKSPYVLMAPAIICALCISVFAIVCCIVLSFYKWDLIANTRTFIGWKNYKYIFHDEVFLKSLSNTLTFAAMIWTPGSSG